MSASEVASKSYEIMDVNQATVERTMREFDVSLLLHGHTHRPAVHRFVLDGKPAASLPITIVAGGTRYRDQQGEIQVTSDAHGQISVTWPAPGMYWLEATVQDKNTSVPQAQQRRPRQQPCRPLA